MTPCVRVSRVIYFLVVRSITFFHTKIKKKMHPIISIHSKVIDIQQKPKLCFDASLEGWNQRLFDNRISMANAVVWKPTIGNEGIHFSCRFQWHISERSNYVIFKVSCLVSIDGIFTDAYYAEDQKENSLKIFNGILTLSFYSCI